MVDVGNHVRNGGLTTSQDDWASQTADTIERVVSTVRDKTTGPALTASRALVYGTFAVIVGVAALVLAVIAAVRLLNNYLPDAVFGESHIWAAYLIIGLLFTIGGLFAWSKRSAQPEETGSG
jgi:hypothetical protein